MSNQVSCCVFDLETTNLSADFGVILCDIVKPAHGKARVFRADQLNRHWHNHRSDDSAITAANVAELSQHDIWVAQEPQQWLAAALDGSRKAMHYIVEHCVQDVLVLEKVIGALKAYSGTYNTYGSGFWPLGLRQCGTNNALPSQSRGSSTMQAATATRRQGLAAVLGAILGGLGAGPVSAVTILIAGLIATMLAPNAEQEHQAGMSESTAGYYALGTMFFSLVFGIGFLIIGAVIGTIAGTTGARISRAIGWGACIGAAISAVAPLYWAIQGTVASGMNAANAAFELTIY